MTSKNQIICITCESNKELVANGFVVCTTCGMTKRRHFVDHLPVKIKKSNEIFSHNSEGKTLDKPGSLGTYMGKLGNATYNLRGSRLKSHEIRKYKRLSKFYQEPAKIDKNATHLRTIVAFKKISQDLSLSKTIQQRSLYLYWKNVRKSEIDKTQITNHVLLIALCLLCSIRESGSNTPIRFSEVISTFAEKGHRVTNKNILRLSRELQMDLTPKRRKAEDYLPRLAGSIRSDPEIRKKMNFHVLSIEEYEMLLIGISNKFLSMLDRKDRGGVQPFPFAVSVLYLSDRLLFKVLGKRPVLTQKLLANAVGSAEFTIRDHIYRFLGDLFKENQDDLIVYTKNLIINR